MCVWRSFLVAGTVACKQFTACDSAGESPVLKHRSASRMIVEEGCGIPSPVVLQEYCEESPDADECREFDD